MPPIGNSCGASTATTENRYAAATPSPISVHILGDRLRSDATNRCQNGHAAHSTTGEASSSSIHPNHGPSHIWKLSPTSSPIDSTRIGTLSAALTISRRVKSTSSGLGPSSSDAITGSSAMPQIGQNPGPSCTICGCIGQVYWTELALSPPSPLWREGTGKAGGWGCPALEPW